MRLINGVRVKLDKQSLIFTLTPFIVMRLAPTLKRVGAVALLLGFSQAAVLADETYSPYVDDAGNISLPDDFRANLVHLGSWFVPEGGASGFHDVYTEQTTVETYRQLLCGREWFRSHCKHRGADTSH